LNTILQIQVSNATLGVEQMQLIFYQKRGERTPIPKKKGPRHPYKQP